MHYDIFIYLNLRQWSQRSLPIALEIYSKDLMSIYPILVYNTHLQKALIIFYSMIKGPKMLSFGKKLISTYKAICHVRHQLYNVISFT